MEDDFERLSVKHLNASQFKIFDSFSFNRANLIGALGAYVWSKDCKYLDCTGGVGVLNFGHNHPDFVNAAQTFLGTSQLSYWKLGADRRNLKFTSLLSSFFVGEMNKVFTVTSGAEAVDVALRTVVKFWDGERPFILAGHRSFHGKSLGAQAISNSNEISYRFPSSLPTRAFTFGSLEDIERLLQQTTSNGKCLVGAVVIESFSASMMEELSVDFLDGLARLREKYGFLIICDEIYCGIFKVGDFCDFFKASDFFPDIVCMGKSLGAGLTPLSAVIFRDSVYKRAYESNKDANLLTSTFSAFPYSLCVGGAVLEWIQRNDVSTNVHLLENAVRQEFEKRDLPLFSALLGKGMYFGLEVRWNSPATDKLLAMLPTQLRGQSRISQKILIASMIEYLFVHHRIITFVGLSSKPLLKISLTTAHNTKDVVKIFDALEEIQSTPVLKMIGSFLRKAL